MGGGGVDPAASDCGSGCEKGIAESESKPGYFVSKTQSCTQSLEKHSCGLVNLDADRRQWVRTAWPPDSSGCESLWGQEDRDVRH